MRRLVVAVGLALVAALPSVAHAHAGNPNYRSVVRGVQPSLPGVAVSVLGYDNQLQLINRSGKDITVLGYDGEPYARLMRDGTVEQNRNSPATYLNEDRMAATPVPKFASSSKAPSWQVLDKTGRFIWHDHRMHWMGRGLPPQVKSKDKKTKVFDYGIPIEMAGQKAKVTGTLFWVGPNNSFPVVPFVILAVLLALSIPLIVRTRRRRAETDAATPEPVPSQEAW
ncbi:MAG: hypothetical protein QOH13_2122 [Thermoleophilaceae bacterium]|jgi:hypothetical protein|nr:hypothetical protein [Solirubrobacteraceae bacterium]MEA2425712.1 hypothetical protein [Thermoleophilaceae bacterium]